MRSTVGAPLLTGNIGKRLSDNQRFGVLFKGAVIA
jgi:hypothetical protein